MIENKQLIFFIGLPILAYLVMKGKEGMGGVSATGGQIDERPASDAPSRMGHKRFTMGAAVPNDAKYLVGPSRLIHPDFLDDITSSDLTKVLRKDVFKTERNPIIVPLQTMQVGKVKTAKRTPRQMRIDQAIEEAGIEPNNKHLMSCDAFTNKRNLRDLTGIYDCRSRVLQCLKKNPNTQLGDGTGCGDYFTMIRNRFNMMDKYWEGKNYNV